MELPGAQVMAWTGYFSPQRRHDLIAVSELSPARGEIAAESTEASYSRVQWSRLYQTHPNHLQTLLGVCAAFLVGCSRSAPQTSGPLPQRGYVWQRDWTPVVADAVLEAHRRMNGIIVLAGEIDWRANQPVLLQANVDWRTLRSQFIPCALALRVAPHRGFFAANGAEARFICETAKSLVELARSHDVALSELQIDFDCPQKHLREYREWLRTLRQALRPLALIVTTLPAWLDDPQFVPLVSEADGFVLQVHSVPISNVNDRTTLCDTHAVRTWVSKAAQLGLPFSVALPTYRCSAGYDVGGKLCGIAMDSVQPIWSPGTRVLELSTDADETALLVNEWQKARPWQMKEIIWYRVPVATDVRNWRWATLSAVMAGRKPVHHLEVSQEGENPIDLSIANTGETDEQLDSIVTATWNSGTMVASDALRGWTVNVATGRAVFTATSTHRTRLAPGETQRIGWLRYEQPTIVRLQLRENG
jgi:Protein of unknown function (DUF3142)